MEKEYKNYNLSEYARSVGVSRNTALAWAKQKRIKAHNPARGVWYIAKDQGRPEVDRPWAAARKERLELQT